MKTIAASDFKARCLALLDDVAAGGPELLILKRGKPVARLVAVMPAAESPQASLLGTMWAADDLLEPPMPAAAWEAESEA
jgi:prevent-host-death family protein